MAQICIVHEGSRPVRSLELVDSRNRNTTEHGCWIIARREVQ